MQQFNNKSCTYNRNIVCTNYAVCLWCIIIQLVCVRRRFLSTFARRIPHIVNHEFNVTLQARTNSNLHRNAQSYERYSYYDAIPKRIQRLIYYRQVVRSGSHGLVLCYTITALTLSPSRPPPMHSSHSTRSFTNLF